MLCAIGGGIVYRNARLALASINLTGIDQKRGVDMPDFRHMGVAVEYGIVCTRLCHSQGSPGQVRKVDAAVIQHNIGIGPMQSRLGPLLRQFAENADFVFNLAA